MTDTPTTMRRLQRLHELSHSTSFTQFDLRDACKTHLPHIIDAWREQRDKIFTVGKDLPCPGDLRDDPLAVLHWIDTHVELQQAEIERLRSAYRWVGNKLTRLEAFVEKVRQAYRQRVHADGGSLSQWFDDDSIATALADLDAEQDAGASEPESLSIQRRKALQQSEPPVWTCEKCGDGFGPPVDETQPQEFDCDRPGCGGRVTRKAVK